MNLWERIHALIAGAGARSIKVSRSFEKSAIQFGDEVRVRQTLETQSSGFAGRTGTVFGQTTPSVTHVDVVGAGTKDYAINVHFDDPKASAWFTERTLEVVAKAGPMKVEVKDGRINVAYERVEPLGNDSSS